MNRLRYPMQLLLVVVFTLMLGGVPVPTAAQTQQAPPPATEAIKRVVVPFLHRLKSGNLKAMKARMSAGLYARYQVLFEQNHEYRQYLRNFYRDVTFNVGSVTAGEGEAVADVQIVWRDGRTGTVHIELSRDPHGRWKISRLSD